ncbi:MAG: DNA topology modulation protein FlaR [Oscillospiraceae bacterium]|jgi:adenylate kinase family enzyme|nr:DNA topology modulation protein FlaR [Oscillospiraceae bacterium]
MKIHIIGGSGSGKTYLANRLSQKYGVPHDDLDDLFWKNTANQYGVKMPREKRDQFLKEILKRKDWIIEGVYHAWVHESFEKADTIIVLDFPVGICKFRVLIRFLKRKMGIEHGKKETIKSLAGLLKWTDQYQKEDLPKIYATLKNHSQKTVVLHTKREEADFIKHFSQYG